VGIPETAEAGARNIAGNTSGIEDPDAALFRSDGHRGWPCDRFLFSRKGSRSGFGDDDAFYPPLCDRALQGFRRTGGLRCHGSGDSDRVLAEYAADGFRQALHVAFSLEQFRQVGRRSSGTIPVELFIRRLFRNGPRMGDPASVPAAHTDLILAAIGEELGFVGFLCIVIAYAVLVYRALRICLLSRGTYSLFLGLGATLLIGLQAAFIAAGILGIVPLSGVVTPFVNYGKSSTVANFLLLGILVSISRDAVPQEISANFRRQALCVGSFLGVVACLIVLQAARVQVFQADYFLGRGALVVQGDGHRRYTYNPRIMDAAHSIPRGTIYDRNGIPLATDSESLVQSFRSQYAQLHVDPQQVARQGFGRLYPFESLTFHILAI